MVQWRPFRVLLIGQQDLFDRVLATNIQGWGYEVVMLPTRSLFENAELDGNVILCDLDESFRTISVHDDIPVYHGMSVVDFLRSSRATGLRNKFMIVLSSGSVSRTTLEEIGAVALLRKPFQVERLQRYLRVLQRLIVSQMCTLSAQRTDEHKTVRILVVDDEEDVACAVSQALTYEPGYEVAVAYDGLDALEQCVEWQPHCIVIDLIMPWMNGYQVMHCLTLCSLRSSPAFVILSALAQRELPIYHLNMKNRTVVYIAKPFHIEHLLAAIKQVCKS